MSQGIDVRFEVEVDMNIPRILAHTDDPAFGLFAAETWYKLYRDYVPNREGTLYDSASKRIRPWEIEHNTPYAAAVYAKNKNYRKDKAPKATAHWSEKAEPAELPKLIKSMQNYIDQGRLRIDD